MRDGHEGPADVRIERRGAIELIWLNRPAARNSIQGTLMGDLLRAARRADADDAVRAIVTTGVGRTYCVGMDAGALSEASPSGSVDLAELGFQHGLGGDLGLPDLSADQRRGDTVGVGPWTQAFLQVGKPTIAAINGGAGGGGLGIAMLHDVRIMARTARLATNFVALGVSPELGISWLLPRIVGLSHAFDLLTRTRPIEAEEALALGLVEAVVEHEELVDAALARGESFARLPPVALRMGKRLLLQGTASSLDDQLERECQNQVRLFSLGDTTENVAGFLRQVAGPGAQAPPDPDPHPDQAPDPGPVKPSDPELGDQRTREEPVHQPITRRRLAGRMLTMAAAVTHERVRPPGLHGAGDVPGTAAQITSEWLTTVLCAEAPGARVSDHTISDASAGSTARGRISLSYNAEGREAGLPASVWFKSAPTLLNRLVVGLTNAAQSEARFYMDIRPGLDISAPRGYYGGADAASGRSLVLIEDLGRTRDAHFGGPRERQVTRSMAESMVAEMAGYHGALWESPRFSGDLAWISDSLAWQENANAVMAFAKRSLIGVDRAARVTAPGFSELKDALYPAFMRALALNISGPTTLLHQDVHAGNWFDADGQMGLYDWHCLARGGWALDVAYALMSGLTVEDRRAWERELIEYYLERLAEAGGEAPTFEQAWLQYRQQVFHGLVFWLFTIGAGALQPDMQPVEISEANLERMSYAVMDLRSLAALNEGVMSPRGDSSRAER